MIVVKLDKKCYTETFNIPFLSVILVQQRHDGSYRVTCYHCFSNITWASTFYLFKDVSVQLYLISTNYELYQEGENVFSGFKILF